MTHRLRLGTKRARVLGPVLAIALAAGSGAAIGPTAAGAADPPPAAGGAPTLNLSDGQTLQGTVSVTAEPTTENDSVVSLKVDGHPVDAEQTAGAARFGFDMGAPLPGCRSGMAATWIMPSRAATWWHCARASDSIQLDGDANTLTVGNDALFYRMGMERRCCPSERHGNQVP